MPKAVLYVESGIQGGGSFESLYQHLQVIDRGEYRPVVVFLNRTAHLERVEQLDIPCFLINDFLYSRKTSRIFSAVIYIIERLKLITDLYLSSLSPAADRMLHYFTIRKIVSIIRENRIDLVHTNNQVNRDLYAVICAQLSGVPCISHLRSFFSKGFNKKKADFINRYVARYIAYSQSVADHWIEQGLASGKVEVVNNAIGDLHADAVDLHDSYNIPRVRKTIGVVGKIIPVRGHAFMLKAFAALLEEYRDVHLLVVGDGEAGYVNRLKRLAEDLGVMSNVTFTGHYLPARDIIASLDILVLPYAIEPFGRVLLEAWKLKTPVVLSDVGHIRGIVKDGDHAILVEYDNVEQLKNELLQLMNDEALCERIADNGFELCRKNFSIETYNKRIEKIYQSII